MKKILSKILVLSILSTTTQMSFAQVNSSGNSLVEMIEDYEYALESRETLTIEIADKIQDEIDLAVKSSSKEQIDGALKTLVARIPNEDQREVLLKKIRFSSKEEISKMLVDPSLIANSIQGEGANFNFEADGTMVVSYLIAAVMLGALIYGIYDVSTHESWESFRSSYSLNYESATCSVSKFNLTSAEKEAMKADAEQKCLAGAKDPNTCEDKGLARSDQRYYTASGFFSHGTCSVYYYYRSEK